MAKLRVAHTWRTQAVWAKRRAKVGNNNGQLCIAKNMILMREKQGAEREKKEVCVNDGQECLQPSPKLAPGPIYVHIFQVQIGGNLDKGEILHSVPNQSIRFEIHLV